MQESASTLERQSQKAQELLDKIHQRTSQSFSIVDQAEWLKDTAFCCQREYPIHTYIQCDLLDPGTSWVFCLAMGRELATLDYLHGSQLVVGR